MYRCSAIHGSTWRHPFIGFLIGPLLTGLALAGMLWEEQHLHRPYFPGTLALLCVIVTAFLWGLAPALLSAVLNSLVLDYLYFPSGGGAFSIQRWDRLLPFFVGTVILAVMISQYEAARQRLQLTQQKECQRANDLEQANHLKDQFLAMASHELKTPITTIRLQAQLSLFRLRGQTNAALERESISTSFEFIEAQTGPLQALVDELLDLSNIRAGKVALHLEVCDFRTLYCAAIEEQRLMTERTIVFESPTTPTFIHADSNRLHQVVTNLLSNAVKYSPEDSAIHMRLATQKQTAVLAIANEGEGIAQEQLALLFEPFYRTPSARDAKKDGSGLGLAIAKSIVEQHQGRIWCESSPGQETIFFVELPLLDKEREGEDVAGNNTNVRSHGTGEL